MNMEALTSQLMANSAYKEGRIQDAIDLTYRAKNALHDDKAKAELQERIDTWAMELYDEECEAELQKEDDALRDN